MIEQERLPRSVDQLAAAAKRAVSAPGCEPRSNVLKKFGDASKPQRMKRRDW
jgi:hypothetical protein